MVRTEVRVAAVLQGVWLPTSPQTASGQVNALRRLQPNAEVTVVMAGEGLLGKVVDLRA